MPRDCPTCEIFGNDRVRRIDHNQEMCLECIIKSQERKEKEEKEKETVRVKGVSE